MSRFTGPNLNGIVLELDRVYYLVYNTRIMNMKLKNTAIVVAAAIALIITGSFVMAPTTALAWGDDWDTGGISGGDYYDSYGIDTYGWGGSDYYDSYGVDTYSSYYPSYSSGYSSYVPSSSGYSYTPSSSGGYSYTPASTPSYSYTPSSASNYSYTPSTSSVYHYSPTSSSANSTSAATASNMTYVSSTNTNTNTNNLANTNTLNQTYNPTNTNVYTPTNVFNPVNNNDARINLIVLGGGTTGTTNTNNLSVNCTINPSTVYVNQNVTFTANASGGNGSYTYSWTGSDGISASGQSFTGMFSYTGTKTATVTVSSNGQTASASCNATVQGNSYNNQTAYCVANPTNSVIGQPVTWTAYTSNNQYSGYYGSTYQWSGSDNLYGSGQTISHVYNTPGVHTANVTIYSNGQTYTASCSTNINGYPYATGGATVIRDTNTPVNGTPVAGVFLNQVPATGVSFGLKMTLFTVGLLMWSLFAAYIVSVKRKAKLAGANGFDGSFGFGNTAGAGSDNVVARINAFKEANLQKKGLVS